VTARQSEGASQANQRHPLRNARKRGTRAVISRKRTLQVGYRWDDTLQFGASDRETLDVDPPFVEFPLDSRVGFQSLLQLTVILVRLRAQTQRARMCAHSEATHQCRAYTGDRRPTSSKRAALRTRLGVRVHLRAHRTASAESASSSCRKISRASVRMSLAAERSSPTAFKALSICTQKGGCGQHI
jgi:hypothetical protein